MKLPTKVYLGTVWRPIRRDSSSCTAILKAIEESGEETHLPVGSHNGGFVKVTEVTHKVPDAIIKSALRNHSASSYKESPEGFEKMSPTTFKELYTIYRTYETTTG